MNDNIEIPKKTFQVIMLESFRYCLGRQSYAVQECVENLTWYWDELSPHVQKMIHREINDAILHQYAGHACDVRQWQKVLKLKTKIED